jgi:AraC-like DNA-binding protein
VATIAEEVGYESEEAFSRAFKRLMGVSPAAWRRGTLLVTIDPSSQGGEQKPQR